MPAAPAAWHRLYRRSQRIRPEVLLQKMPSSIVLLVGRDNAAASVTRMVKLVNNSVENLATLWAPKCCKSNVIRVEDAQVTQVRLFCFQRNID
jgi:hypothetical protein